MKPEKLTSEPRTSTPPTDENERPIYRIALLSNAMHQDNYARLFARHPRLKIVAVVDESGQEPYVVGRNRALAELYGVPYVEDLDALSAPNVDAVSIGAQIERRGRLAVEVVRRGKHLWLDKPPVATADEADALSSAVDSAGVRSVVVSFNASPWSTAVRQALADGAIGDLLALHLDFHFAKGHAVGLLDRRVPSGDGARERWTFRDPGAATDPTQSSHNVIAKRELVEVGWYAFAIVQSLCPQTVRRIFATAGAYFFPEHQRLGLEDFATVNMTLADGPVVTISTGRTGQRSHPGGSRTSLRAVGTRGTLIVDGGRPSAVFHGEPPADGRVAPRVVGASDSAGLAHLVDNFVACLDGTTPSMQTARQGCDLLQTILAAYDSIATGRVIDVAPRSPPDSRFETDPSGRYL